VRLDLWSGGSGAQGIGSCHAGTLRTQRTNLEALDDDHSDRTPRRAPLGGHDARASGLYGAFFVKGASRHFCRALLLHSFVRPAPRAFFHPDRTLPSPSRAAAVKDGASSAPPKACPSPTRARRQAARDRVVGRAMIRGEPAIGREQSREPRLYSVEPTWGLDHEAVIRFCGQGSEAAGPFSQRHCSHSRIRIAATSDRHRLPGSSNAVRCRTLFVLSRSRVLLTRVLLTPPAATRHRPAPHRS
jgi:hypothetical protein